MKKPIPGLLLLLILFIFTACNPQPAPQPTSQPTPTSQIVLPATVTPTPLPPARMLTVCLGQEPASLFLYADGSAAARSVRAAIYDGPYDIVGYQLQPVILQEIPSLANGGARLEVVPVSENSVVADQTGALNSLVSGQTYLPAGCRSADCAQVYAGSEPASMDQLVVTFKLLPGLLWSDGAPLSAADSVYAYEVARALFPRVRSELMGYTQSYQALDETTIEWRGAPGYQGALYPTFFFSPLPRHAWSTLQPTELLEAELSARMPLGWGPYVIDEWAAGDHISLSRNPNYFRAAQGLPHFDHLVYRLVDGADQALAALLAGECDVLDETALADASPDEMRAQGQSAALQVISGSGVAWEHIDFGINHFDPAQPSPLQAREVRQAVAQCLDRPALVEQIFSGQAQALNTYAPEGQPLFAGEARRYGFDPQAAATLLDSVGWLDADQDPSTPRTAAGVPGVLDGSSLQVTYQTITGTLRQEVAQWVQASLAQCGIGVSLEYASWEQLFAPGPEGPVFGRRFDLVQFAWMTSAEPPCWLYTSPEIPGPYPDFPKGWGGANASGYSNPAYDQACNQARFSLYDSPEYTQAHQQAQGILAEDVPVLPLYLHPRWMAARTDLCGLAADPSTEVALWNLETLDYGEGCGK